VSEAAPASGHAIAHPSAGKNLENLLRTATKAPELSDPFSIGATRRARAERAARQMIVKAAADLLSGPGGLVGYLRTRLEPGAVASVSLPLDVGTATETIPVQLRRPGRGARPGLPVPRLRPAGRGVPAASRHPPRPGRPDLPAQPDTLCTFRHLIAVHRWGWGIVLHPDGAVTATSPDGSKILHSHGPPPAAAA